MSKDAFKVKNSLQLKPVDLATIVNPQQSQLATDINDFSSLKSYNALLDSWDLVNTANIPITQEATIDVAGSGNFIAGTFLISRSGSSVTITTTSNVTFGSSATPSSAAGVVPVWARPSLEVWNRSYIDRAISIKADGSIAYLFNSARTSDATASISYSVASQNTLSGLVSQANLGKGRGVKTAGQTVTTTLTTVAWNSFSNEGLGFTFAGGQFTATRKMQLLVLAQIDVSNLTAGKNFYLRVNGSNVNITEGDNTSTNSSLMIHDLITVNPGDIVDTVVSTDSSTVTLSGNSARSFIQFVEYPFSNVSIQATPSAELYLETGNGFGSTNTVIRRYTNVRNNTLGSLATYTDSATLGASVTVNVKSKWAVSIQDVRTGGVGRAGFSVNSANNTTQIQNLTYAQGRRGPYMEGPTSGVYGNASTTLVLNPGDIVRPHCAAGEDPSAANASFTMTFLGWTS